MDDQKFYLKLADGTYLGPLDYTSATRMWEQDTRYIGVVETVPAGSEVVDPIDGTVKVML